MSSNPNKTSRKAAAPKRGQADPKHKKATAARNPKPAARNPKPAVRMNSITRRIHFLSVRHKLGSILLITFGVLLFSFLAFAAYHEIKVFGTISWDNKRSFLIGTAQIQAWSRTIPALYYRVTDPEGLHQFTAEVLPAGLIVLVPTILVAVFRLLHILVSWHSVNVQIRKILRPINELALKADELSRMSFSEDKYHMLEDAITHIDPEQMQSLSFGDSDLAGVETAMNNLLTRMKESYRQQARFVNDASHELRTPIAIIEGYANMLDRWGTEDEKVLTESIAAIKNESSHMNHLVEQLLFLARGDSGRTTLQQEETSLADLMQEIYEESLMIDEKHQYHYSRPDTDIVILADTGLLKQAVRILVDNAAKYTNEHDDILLSVGEADGHPYLQVQDTGIGMAEADISHMFDRFYRSDEVRRYKGTGLGLSISKWIVDKHNGHFEVTSRPGLGTRIRVVL